MCGAIDRAIELFQCEELRARTLELKLRQGACFVFRDLRFREIRIANDVREEIECLIEILDEA